MCLKETTKDFKILLKEVGDNNALTSQLWLQEKHPYLPAIMSHQELKRGEGTLCNVIDIKGGDG